MTAVTTHADVEHALDAFAAAVADVGLAMITQAERLRTELGAALRHAAPVAVPQCAGPPFETPDVAGEHRVIAARDWRPGMQYACFRGGEGAPATLDELHHPVVWSSGMPAWALPGNQPLVVRDAPATEDLDTYEREPEPTAPSPLPAAVEGHAYGHAGRLAHLGGQL